jgi:hypothetical protein
MTFVNWLLKRQGILPPADRLALMIRAAGPAGIPEGELRSAVDLPWKTVNDLLDALVRAWQVRVVEREGKRVYVAFDFI